ncbi:MAG TPA: peptide ABC transporter substrate-binding protein [Candidatus Limnocylindria bacterium]|nr:peptide ABC transporter substrate-binding protein [Candidatus Limnocylindria bacterium]
MPRLTSAGRWPRLAVGIVALVVAIAVALNGTLPSSLPAGAAGPELRYLGGELKTLDPAYISDAADVQLLLQLYAGLTRLDENGEPYASLAEDWTVSDDGRSYTFRLRDDLSFSDGTPLRAEDVRRSWLRILDPTTATTAPDVLSVIRGADERLAGGSESEVGIQAPDDRTLVVELRHPAAYFPAIAATPTAFVVPPHADASPDWQSVDGFVGSGPYVVDRVDGDTLYLAANRRYVAGSPPIEELRWVMELDGDGATAYADEQLDLVSVPSFDASWIAFDPELGRALHQAAALNVQYFGFDVTAPPFDDPSVRRAFALALDRPRLVELAEGSGSTPASSLVPPALWPEGMEDDQQSDPGEARRLLDEAGYRDRSDLGVITVNGGGLGVGPAVAVWREELGVEVVVEGMEFADYLRALEERPPQVFTINWIADYPSPYALYSLLLLPNAASNYGGWTDEDFVRLLEEASSAETDAEQAEAYREVDAHVDEQAPVIPWAYGTSWWLVRPGLRGLGNLTTGILDFGRVSWDG